MGLSKKHHKELNQVLSVSPGRYDELREKYANDPVALQQIDVYDPSTEYHQKLKQFVWSLQSGDEKKEAELRKWFEKHYPDIG